MSLREWLILLGAVIVIGIILDGIRRMHRARKDSLEISRGMGADQLEDSPLDEHNPELPGGGARIIDRLGVSASERNAAADRPLERRSSRQPATDEPSEEGLSAGGLDDQLPEDFSLHAEAHDDADRAWAAPADDPLPEEQEEYTASASADRTDPPTLKTPSAARRPDARKRTAPSQRSTTRRPFAGRKEPTAQTAVPPTPEKKAKRTPAGSNRPPAKEVFVINVDSRTPEGFQGGDLKRIFEACGLEHGDMDIYHRHENDDTETPVQFSVANAVEPGTFSPAQMETMATPGISFFMSLPGPTDSLQAYDFMIETAQCVVRNLGGDLKDERRSVMTAQTIEHGRQRVREFERKRRSVKA